MPNTEKISERVIVTLRLEAYRALYFLAQKMHLSIATLARVLILEGLEKHEKEDLK
jgi:hypothetical protein